MKLGLKSRSYLSMGITYLVLGLLLFMVMFPFYWMVATSFKTQNQLDDLVNIWAPDPFTLENYKALWNESLFKHWFGNSVFVSFFSLTISVRCW